jgi:hypothetical protein
MKDRLGWVSAGDMKGTPERPRGSSKLVSHPSESQDETTPLCPSIL